MKRSSQSNSNEELAERLRDGSYSERLDAMLEITMRRVRSPALEDALFDVLRIDNDAVVKRAAVDALLALDEKRSADRLLAALGMDPADIGEPSIARKVAELGLIELRSLDNKPAIETLLSDEDEDVREALAYSLGRRNDAQARRVLERMFACDRSASVRAAAIGSLAQVGALEAVFAAAKADEPEIRAAAVEALARVPGDAAADTISEAAGDPARRVRRTAARSLALRGEDAVAAAQRAFTPRRPRGIVRRASTITRARIHLAILHLIRNRGDSRRATSRKGI